MNQPTVSVCIPTYNGDKHIQKAIESVIEQSFTDFELLIIDDASTDETRSIVRSFKDMRIRSLENEKTLGMANNWNRCLDNAKGNYIQILCQDDCLAKDCLQKKIEAFAFDKEISLVFGSSFIINNNGKILMKRQPFRLDKLFEGRDIAHKSFVQKNIYGEPSNVMFKREISKKAGLFDHRLCYSLDWDYWIRLSLLGKAYYINDYLMCFRISNTSATSNLMKTKAKLTQDDRQFIKNCMQNEKMKLSTTDILLHKTNVALRLLARELFFKMFSN